ncbi:tRNA pseudouridine(13) synthase TruD [Oceanimonas sp. NS1]|nr:tRNA pseudouridine(13) synthase TruD [Oceanimonas sp. NS1]
MYLSAARSHLFNLAVSHRLAQGQGEQLLHGDCVMLAGSQSFFTINEDNPPRRRPACAVCRGRHSPERAAVGRGRLPAEDEAATLELAALAGQQDLMDGLEANGLKQERRTLLLKPGQLSWQQNGDCLTLSFWLPAGSYATSLVREIIREKDSHENTGE